jgi:hypothetical protein
VCAKYATVSIIVIPAMIPGSRREEQLADGNAAIMP